MYNNLRLHFTTKIANDRLFMMQLVQQGGV